MQDTAHCAWFIGWSDVPHGAGDVSTSRRRYRDGHFWDGWRSVMLKRSRLVVSIAAVAVHAAFATPTFGAECNGVTAPDTVKIGGSDLVLNGMGIRKATMLQAKVYVGSLYLPEKSKDGGHILATNRPWQLVLRFVRDVDVSDMRDALEEGFRKAAGNKLAAFSQRIETLKASKVAEFKKGQYLSFTNDPTRGVAVDVNGAGGPTIRGADFSLALLSMWIGAEPRDVGLKAGLLGGACE